MDTLAVIFERPQEIALGRVGLTAPGADDVIVDIQWSGISSGTERLLWSGRMPPFPGMGYPLIPGYESVGQIADKGKASAARAGDFVFVPGARCFGDVRGLFGGAAARLVVPADRAIRLDQGMGEQGVLMALAATAYHVTAAAGTTQPDLIVGHGVLGRLLARIAVARGAKSPTVWETNAGRRGGKHDYEVIDPATDDHRAYSCICDVSGDASILDTLIQRLGPGGEIVLAGFYETPLSFAFPPAFMREARMRVAAEWKPADLQAVKALVESGQLSLDGLITHRAAAADASDAYRTAFADPSCLKMVLDWRQLS
jgi:bacteriochlorophyllide a dehydrogenase